MKDLLIIFIVLLILLLLISSFGGSIRYKDQDTIVSGKVSEESLNNNYKETYSDQIHPEKDHVKMHESMDKKEITSMDKKEAPVLGISPYDHSQVFASF